jgi:ribonuclease Z
MRRRTVGTLALSAVVVLVAGWAVFRSLGGFEGVQRLAIRQVLEDQHSELFEDGRLHVFTLGTGSPQLGSGRMPVANAIIAGDEFLLLDAGEGASRTMGELQLPVRRITGVLITHWHSDHFAGLGQVLNQSWNADRRHEVLVHGPEGVERVMDGLERMYRDDIRYRSAGDVESNDPAYALGTPVAVSIPMGAPRTVVFERNGVVVSAFHVDHGHVQPALGFRVEYNGRSVVFSGDTVASPLVAEAARDCDLLVHEAVNTRLMRSAIAVLRELGNEVAARRAAGVIRYHADTIGVAKVAAQARAGRLVLSHVIPGPTNPLLGRLFLSGMKEHYGGPIVLASDGQHFAL